MDRRSAQTPSAVVMVRPHHFSPNQETANDNAFQQSVEGKDADVIAKEAYNEVTRAAEQLNFVGIRTHIFEDETRLTPDSVFPNNWFSTHSGGHVAIYPMFAQNRRLERRADIIDMLKATYRVQDVIDYSGLEHDGLFLEGTGAMVLDHNERVAYAVNSNRTNQVILERFCTHFNYEPMVFGAVDAGGLPVYHTNVLMCIATDFVLIGLDMIQDVWRREEIIQRFEASGRDVIALTNEQVSDFAGNAIELYGGGRRILVLSARALKSLTVEQTQRIERSAQILALEVPTIEYAGGSVRCMLAGVHLSPR